MDLDKVLLDFYKQYNPLKVEAVPVILQRFHGKEVELLNSLKLKYNLDSYPPFDKLVGNLPKSVQDRFENDKTESVVVLLNTITRLNAHIKHLSTNLLSEMGKNWRENERIENKLHEFRAALSPEALLPVVNSVIEDSALESSHWQTNELTVKTLEVLLQAPQVELRAALQEILGLEDRIQTQNTQIEHLNATLSMIDVGNLRREQDDLIEVTGLKRTISRQKIKDLTNLAKNAQLQITQLETKVQQLEDEIRRQKEIISLAEECRANLTKSFIHQIYFNQAFAAESINEVKETMWMEREDVLTQHVKLAELQKELIAVSRDEDQRERQRLRFELITARRTVKAQDKEIKALVAHLVISEEKIDALQAGRQPFWDDQKCV